MTMPIMRGPTLLREIVAEHMAAEAPAVVQAMRTQYGLNEWTLPSFTSYNAIDPTLVGNDEFPAFGAVVMNDRGHTRESWDLHAQVLYSPVYSMRLFVVARTPRTQDEQWEEPAKESALRVRDDLTRVVQHVLLDKPSLGHPESVRCEETSLLTDYVEPFLANRQSGRWIAASVITIEIHFTESTYVPKIADADTVIVTADKLIP